MTPTDAYRGAGRPEATYAIERAMDSLAAKIGVDPLELRRRNFIRQPSSSRTRRAAGSSTTPATTTARRRRPPSWSTTTTSAPARRTQNVARRRRSASASASSSYFEMCGLAPSRVLASLNYSAGGWEAATVRVLPTAQGPGRHRHVAARPGPRDGVVR